MLPLLTQGSVKDIYGKKGVALYVFDFSNRYSIFDWGAMPDELEKKGEALAYMAWAFFELLDLPHHALGYNKDPKQLEVRPVDVLRPKFSQGEWDYEVYGKRPENTLVPLEFIFRFGVPQGSSLMKRVKDESYLRDLGLEKMPRFGDEFDRPLVEFSTKLEPCDRYIGQEEAKSIAGLTEEEYSDLQELVKKAAIKLRETFSEMGIKLWDGKFELAFGENKNGKRSFFLVDSIGPDELRLTKNGVPLSKENLRSFYRETPWHMATVEAKEIAKKRQSPDWKKICLEQMGKRPEPLDKTYKYFAEGIYTGLANSLAQKCEGRDLFPDSPSLEEVSEFFREKMS